jgi:hypothetical protein
MGEYVLKVAVFHQPTNKPGDPFTYKTYGQGDKVTIEDDERANELIDAGALESPQETKARKAAERKSDSDDGPQGPGDSEPPKGDELDEDAQSPAGSLATPNDPDTEGAGVVMNTTSDSNTQANAGETARGTEPRSTRKRS